jgi:predicted ferric reductase
MPATPREEPPVEAATRTLEELVKRVYIPLTASSPPGLVEADTVDPWTQAGKYALGWTYFALVLLVLVSTTRVYHLWTDKLRQAMHKQEVSEFRREMYAHLKDSKYGFASLATSRTVNKLFPRHGEKGFELTRGQSHWSSFEVVNDTLALFRWVFYRPVPELKWKKKTILSFPSLAVLTILTIALAFVALYCFLPQPLYWESIAYGSPPVAIRAGMLSVAMTPWIIALSMKSNLISMMTGIGHDRLGVFHRWGGYLCLFLALVHMVPFYIQPVWGSGGRAVFASLFNSGIYVYGTGLAAIVPLGFLCIASLPFLRARAYELFVIMHIPVGILYVGLLFWHCSNKLSSWSYLYATVVIWGLSYFMRLFNLNWLKPWRKSAWLVGDEAAITLMADNCIKVTVPTQMTWKPGQHVFLRMPGISVFENHPFTISSLCSQDLPSEYGEEYKDCTLVFRPFGGFTRKVLNTAIENGPLKTYRAYLEGPYGGMQRELAAFETVILFAGGSGITAIVSHLLNLIKRMRDGKAVTQKIEVIWVLKKLEAMDWFREELRICRESAPPDTVNCRFFVTGAERPPDKYALRSARPVSMRLHNKLDGFVAGIASKRNSALIREEAQGDPNRERELRAEDEDAITSLPQPKYLQPRALMPLPQTTFDPPPTKAKKLKKENSLKKSKGKDQKNPMQLTPYEVDPHEATRILLSSRTDPDPQAGAKVDPHYEQDSKQGFLSPNPIHPEIAHTRKSSDLHLQIPVNNSEQNSSFDFGFPETPNNFQKDIMRFAFGAPLKNEGWSTEYGRPNLGHMLKDMATGGDDGKGFFGRRTCVFVCGPPSMRVELANMVANLQADIWGDDSKDEIFLHTENYAI